MWLKISTSPGLIFRFYGIKSQARWKKLESKIIWHMSIHRTLMYKLTHHDTKLGAVQKLRNSQRGEGVNDFVTYRSIYFEGEGVFMK